MLQPTSIIPTKGIQGHLLAYRSKWNLNLQGRDKSPMNTSPVKAPSLLWTTAMLYYRFGDAIDKKATANPKKHTEDSSIDAEEENEEKNRRCQTSCRWYWRCAPPAHGPSPTWPTPEKLGKVSNPNPKTTVIAGNIYTPTGSTTPPAHRRQKKATGGEEAGGSGGGSRDDLGVALSAAVWRGTGHFERVSVLSVEPEVPRVGPLIVH